MKILNFVQPLSDKNYTELFELTQIDFVKEDEIFISLDSELFQNLDNLFRNYGNYIYSGLNFVILPLDSVLSAKIIAELYGRFCYFPPIIELTELENNTFKVISVVNLTEQYAKAREKREITLHQR